MKVDPKKLFEIHSSVIEKKITQRRFHHADIEPLITDLENYPLFEVNPVGKSFENRTIYSIKSGNGNTSVLLWSQMHGNESTATMALLDIFNFFKENDLLADFKKIILDNLTLYFIPMLNPDGAERFQRRNALGIDLNRDALKLQSPESQLLTGFRNNIKADFGFNLHDQDNNHGAGKSGNPATISFLAPPVDYQKSVNDTREKSIRIIGLLYTILKDFIPGHVGRYSDDFEPRAFGENVQMAGTSTILMESGGYRGDPEKQFIRKLNFVTLLSALFCIANGDYQNVDTATYFQIPQNKKLMFDFIIRNARIQSGQTVDIGINRNEKELPESRSYYYHSQIDEIGDMSIFHGYEEFDAEGMNVKPGKIYSQILDSVDEIENLDILKLLRNGYTSVKMKPSFHLPKYLSTPLHIMTRDSENTIETEKNPNFLLYKNEQLRYVVVNGFMYDVLSKEMTIPNGIIS